MKARHITALRVGTKIGTKYDPNKKKLSKGAASKIGKGSKSGRPNRKPKF